MESGSFSGARSVDTLDLSDNLLTEVPTSAIMEATNLRHLDLSANPIEAIGPNAFQNIYDLEKLSLDYMHDLMTVSGHAFLDNIRLSSLSLENNKRLMPLPYGVFSSNTMLKVIGFRNNSWATLSPNQVMHKTGVMFTNTIYWL